VHALRDERLRSAQLDDQLEQRCGCFEPAATRAPFSDDLDALLLGLVHSVILAPSLATGKLLSR
jgi:hypothetical protein